MKWEYNLLLLQGNILQWAEVINRLGRERWELVTVILDETEIAFFKRPKEDYGKQDKEETVKEATTKEDTDQSQGRPTTGELYN